ncbi:exodeoxyribonuclease I [Methylothermus subterraneus]
MSPTLYWYDYETFGADPVRDRPAQFAGWRTDLDLNPVGEPLVLYCRPADDFLPQPRACLLTGITPQLARAKGLPEAEFIGRIRAEFCQPNTCVAGYNTIRFDDEVTRHCLYRNLFDPYAHEWQGGNSRWDLIDVMRLTYALRPEGIVWPQRADGAVSFKLDQLAAANGIDHLGAHDALADVRATIELARLLRARRPKIYAYCFNHRRKADALRFLDLEAMQPVLHVSEKYPACRGCLAMVAPIGADPNNPNGVIVYDLSVDPEPFLTCDVEALRARLFTPKEQLPEGSVRLPLKTVRVNRCPVLAPVAALRPEDAERLAIDTARCLRHLKVLRRHRDLLRARLAALFKPPEAIADPDLMLYRGGFFSASDRARLDAIRQLPPERLRELALEFDDPRLPEMVFRYRARNWPQTLSAEERRRWDEFRLKRLTRPESGASIVWSQYLQELRALARSEADPSRLEILKALEAYAREILPPCPELALGADAG